MGVPGSGKTSLAKRILREVKCVYLDNNFIADAFFSKTRVSKEYIEIRGFIYQALYRITLENLIVANNVLLDIPHVTHMKDKKWVVFIQGLARRSGATLKIIRCHCGEDELKLRITLRGEERDTWKLNNWEKFLENEPIMLDVPIPHIDIDTTLSNDKQLTMAINYIHE
jgi:adenylate kinase family enzyme